MSHRQVLVQNHAGAGDDTRRTVAFAVPRPRTPRVPSASPAGSTARACWARPAAPETRRRIRERSTRRLARRRARRASPRLRTPPRSPRALVSVCRRRVSSGTSRGCAGTNAPAGRRRAFRFRAACGRLARRRRRPHVGGAEVELDLLTGYVLDVPAQRRRKRKFAEYTAFATLGVVDRGDADDLALGTDRVLERPAHHPGPAVKLEQADSVRVGIPSGRGTARGDRGTGASTSKARASRTRASHRRRLTVGDSTTRSSRARRGACRRAGRCGRGSFQVFGRGDERDGRTRRVSRSPELPAPARHHVRGVASRQPRRTGHLTSHRARRRSRGGDG